MTFLISPRYRACWRHAVLRGLLALALPFALGSVALAQPAGDAAAAGAWSFGGEKTLVALMGDGSRIHIGHIRFTPVEGGGGAARYQLTLAHERFTDHFLSMREFKCLAGGPEISCQVPYPYANPLTVGPGSTPAELAWLEHSLMFLHKSPAEFGAKLWNGLIFSFKADGPRLVGTPQAIDLNEIASPPKDPKRPPYGKAQRHEVPEGTRWLRGLVIE